MSAFNYIPKYFLFLFFLSFGCSGQGVNSNPGLKSKGYNIILGETGSGDKWGNYTFHHLSKRCSEKDIVTLHEKHNGFKNIRVEVDNNLPNDYKIEHTKNELILKTRNNNAIIWLIYQFINQLSREDERFSAEDLPPSYIEFYTHSYDFDFSYREPYFTPNLQKEFAPIIGTNSVETDWGIWGHNLSKILQEDENSDIYARSGNEIIKDQFCFSNDETFRQIREYIIDNFGNDSLYTQRIMIMPNDNDIVCNCDLCQSKGNTPTNATPAVSYLIRKLSTAFPYHSFFTSAYLSTKNPPKEKLPSKTGVIISTINIPKGVALEQQKEVKRFLDILTKWEKYTPNIYIWDYASNFDDYLTPAPILYGLQKQLRFYKSVRVKGVFLNASGYDYSSFDDMKNYVASALMIDTELSVDELCRKYFTQYYPESGNVLADYYLSLEKKFDQKIKPYNIYAGFREIKNSYLDKDEFVDFYNRLPSLIEKANGEEKIKLQKLRTALSFTRLQIAHSEGHKNKGYASLDNSTMKIKKKEIQQYINYLSNYQSYADLSNYKEANGKLSAYIENWKEILNQKPVKNLLIGKPVQLISKMNDGYTDIDILNDGVLGFGSDYHQGWLLYTNNDLHLKFDTKDIGATNHLTIRFLADKRHRIYPPQKIEIYTDGRLYKKMIPREEEDHIASIKTELNLDGIQSVDLKIYHLPQSGRSTLACDEILLN